MKPDVRKILQPVHPVAREIAQTGLLPLGPDAVMEQYRLSDPEFRRRRVCPDFFKLSDVGGLRLVCRHQRPHFLDLVPLHIEKSRTLRGVQPFMEAGPEVIAIQIALLEGEMAERMR